MPSVYDLKPHFQNLLRPCCNLLARQGVTANQVTVAAVVLSVVTGLMMALGGTDWFFLLPLVLFIRMALNAIDGMLAREHDQQSKLGAILNELGDVVSDAALYLPLALYLDLGSAIMVVIIVVMATISEMAGVVSVQIGGSRRYEGPMGKSDRALAFGVLALLATSLPVFLMGAALGAIIGLLGLTIKNRVDAALIEVKRIRDDAIFAQLEATRDAQQARSDEAQCRGMTDV